MISKDRVQTIIETKLTNDLFLVELNVSEKNNINVLIDGDQGIVMGQYIAISKSIKKEFDEIGLNYSLEVSSPGLDRPFSHDRQYTKNIGKEVEVQTNDNEKIKGKLLTCSTKEIELKVDNQTKLIDKNNIIETKVLITF